MATIENIDVSDVMEMTKQTLSVYKFITAVMTNNNIEGTQWKFLILCDKKPYYSEEYKQYSFKPLGVRFISLADSSIQRSVMYEDVKLFSIRTKLSSTRKYPDNEVPIWIVGRTIEKNYKGIAYYDSSFADTNEAVRNMVLQMYERYEITHRVDIEKIDDNEVIDVVF